MGASTLFLCLTIYVCLQSLCKSSHTCHKNQVKVTHKNNVLAPIVGKDLEQNFHLEIVLGAIEGLIKGAFFFMFHLQPPTPLNECSVEVCPGESGESPVYVSPLSLLLLAMRKVANFWLIS